MLRDLQTGLHTTKNTMRTFAGTAAVKTGTAAIVDHVAGTVKLPPNNTSVGLIFLDREREVVDGMNLFRTNISDHDEDFVTIKPGEHCSYKAYPAGDRIATSEYVKAGLVKGCYLDANAQGQVKQTATVTKYIFDGFYDDNGHELAIIEIRS